MNGVHFQQYADDVLLNLLIEGNREAFDVIYLRYWEQLYFYLVKAIKDTKEAEDILQAVFVSLWSLNSSNAGPTHLRDNIDRDSRMNDRVVRFSPMPGSYSAFFR